MKRLFHASATSWMRRAQRNSNPITSARLTNCGSETNYYVEHVRMAKAQTALMEDKIRREFPLLKNHAVKYTPFTGLTFLKKGSVYPGSDINPDPKYNWCEVRCPVDLLLPNAEEVSKRKLVLLAGEFYDKDSDELRISTDRFPSYGQNKKWLVDTLAHLKTCALDLSEDFADLQLELAPADTESQTKTLVHAFPEEWKRLDMAHVDPQAKKRCEAPQ